MAKNIKVLIAEDHDVVREGLKILLRADPGVEVAGEANNGATAVSMAKKLQPDVVLMDLAMPQANGLEATKGIRLEVPGAKVLILSAYKDEGTVQKAVAAGASGYLTKHSAAEELLEAIREVSKGNRFYGRAVAGKLGKGYRQVPGQGKASTPKPVHLTPREVEVLQLVASGQPNKAIAFKLGISIKTIEKHRQAAMDKLEIHDVATLTRYAMDKGLVPPA